MADLQSDSGVSARQDLFVAEFRRWRDLSGLSRAATKVWPSVRRINQAQGHRNLVCSCPPVEAFSS